MAPVGPERGRAVSGRLLPEHRHKIELYQGGLPAEGLAEKAGTGLALLMTEFRARLVGVHHRVHSVFGQMRVDNLTNRVFSESRLDCNRREATSPRRETSRFHPPFSEKSYRTPIR